MPGLITAVVLLHFPEGAITRMVHSIILVSTDGGGVQRKVQQRKSGMNTWTIIPVLYTEPMPPRVLGFQSDVSKDSLRHKREEVKVAIPSKLGR